MGKIQVVALANTVALIDFILHPLFHLWMYIDPQAYEWAMNLFVGGLHLQVTEFDYNTHNILLGTFVEPMVFWLLGASVAFLYNKFSTVR